MQGGGDRDVTKRESQIRRPAQCRVVVIGT